MCLFYGSNQEVGSNLSAVLSSQSHRIFCWVMCDLYFSGFTERNITTNGFVVFMQLFRNLIPPESNQLKHNRRVKSRFFQTFWPIEQNSFSQTLSCLSGHGDAVRGGCTFFACFSIAFLCLLRDVLFIWRLLLHCQRSSDHLEGVFSHGVMSSSTAL